MDKELAKLTADMVEQDEGEVQTENTGRGGQCRRENKRERKGRDVKVGISFEYTR